MEVETNGENGAEKLAEDIEKLEVGEEGGMEESPGDDDSKYTEEDLARRVIVKNFPFKTTTEAIEEFFADDSFGSIEHLSKKFRGQAWKEKKGLPVVKKFTGVVIATFEDEEGAKKFLELEDLKFQDRKVRKYSLTESKERREKFLELKKERIETAKKKKIEAHLQRQKEAKEEAEKKKKAKTEAKNEKSTNPSDCIVVCKGFHMNADSLQEVMKYFYDNHENVIDVQMNTIRDRFGNQRWDEKAFITFMNKGSADRFLGLAYVRFKGNKINRMPVSEFKAGKKGGKEQAGTKRKLPEEEKKQVELEKGAAIKIKGIQNKYTKVMDIKDKLKMLDVKWEDVVFVNHQKGDEEAQVRLKGAASKDVAELINKFNDNNIMMGDLVTAVRITGKEEQELTEKAKEHLSTQPKKDKVKKQRKDAKKQKDFLENY